MTEENQGICLGADLCVCFQGLSDPSGSEWSVCLGNYEKSYNNVLFTAFVISLLGSECCLSPNQKQRSMGLFGRQALATAVDWAQHHCVCSAFHSRPPCPATGPWEVAGVAVARIQGGNWQSSCQQLQRLPMGRSARRQKSQFNQTCL